eukprot:TRINITY_DN22414_c0_g1_i1.p1 TRINITY_DN22414_c0_g1~~TRINITY_DN22414_c0_g1_i1.p1  ORF type:complete len:230 (-),score=43.99 TRINITY_DN22414_c0_g1_i1:65-754(-)
MPVDYSRFDGIGDTDSDDASGEQPPWNLAPGGLGADPSGGSAPAPPPRPPSEVLDDLEDYFQRLDARRAESEASAAAPPPSVERFDDEDFTALRSFPAGAAFAGRECAVCLAFIEQDEELISLPCAAAHTFHAACARGWLDRNVTCPLCRVDVRSLVRASSPRRPQPSPRAFGRTRDGGVISRYDPHPPPGLPRPAYIPEDLRHVAELVEIEYPERGVARIWRIPRGES